MLLINKRKKLANRFNFMICLPKFFLPLRVFHYKQIGIKIKYLLTQSFLIKIFNSTLLIRSFDF